MSDKKEEEEPSCCPPNRAPALQHPEHYKKKGKFITADGVRMYVVGDAKKGARAVVVIADVHGLDSGRHMAICDSFAEKGFYAVGPDIFTTDDFKADSGKFLTKWSDQNESRLAMDATYKHLASIGIPGARTGLIGFCWGSWLVFKESARVDSAKHFACGVNCHPSLIIEEKFAKPAGSMAAMGEAATHPMLMLPCKGDPDAVQEGGIVQKSLKKKSFGSKCGMLPFPTMAHGFVSQGDVTDDEVRGSVEKAMGAATAFFEAMLGSE